MDATENRPVRLFTFAPALLFLAFIWPFGGGKNVQMVAGSLTPAARCTVHVDKGDNGNTALELKAQSLAAPSSLTPAKNDYVVWLQPPDRDVQNVGKLTVDGDEKAHLKTVTPYRRFKIFITAENQAQLQSPEGPTVLSAEVQEGKN